MPALDDRTTHGATGAAPVVRDGEAPQQIGRYTVLKLLGSGGMGVVYAAYDTDLDRKVAIKLLHVGVAEAGPGTTGHGRLMREAQAMAKISHPNVLQVFEVGLHAGQVFLALEFVEGTTLDGWLLARPRTWREVLAVFLQAGRGLEAAHAVGLVHRDFKPDNVLVDRDGHVHVMDFGLARVAGSADPDAPPVPVSLSTSQHLHSHLTVTGAVMGTPLYMAPEQHLGGATDARTDEFAFCVALHEGLYGQRPFAGDDIQAIASNVLQGIMREPPRHKKLPAWLRRAVVRGLAPEPADRYPTMTALLADLGRDRGGARTRWLLAGATAASLALGTWGVLHEDQDLCSGADQQISQAWDPARAEAVADALRGTGRPFADRTWSKVQAHLDAYAREWQDRHVAACETHARGESSDDFYDLELACLARRRSELAALVDRLAHADGDVVERAVAAARALTPISACADREALLARVKPPDDPTLRAEVDRLRAELDQAKAAQDAGKYADGVAVAAAVAAAADATSHRPLIAEARLRLGELYSRAADYPSAEAALTAALWAAEAGRHDEAAAATWTELVRLGVKSGKFTEAERAAERAGAAVARLGVDVLAEARLDNELGGLAFHSDEPLKAVERYRRALALREQALGEDHPDTLNTLGNLANALYRTDRADEAEEAMKRTLALREQLLGPDHPEVAITLNNLGVLYRMTKRPKDALAACQRARDIWRVALGPDNATSLTADLNIANIHIDAREFAEAQKLLEEVVATAERILPEEAPQRQTAVINLAGLLSLTGQDAQAEQILRGILAQRERQYGADSPKLTETLANLGVLALRREDEASAERDLSRAVKHLERTNGLEHSDLIAPLCGLAVVHIRQGRWDAAAPFVRRARAIADKIGGDDHRKAGNLMLAEGLLALGQGHPAAARDIFQRCLARPGCPSDDPLDRAEFDFGLARALALTDGDRTRARTLAESARAAWLAHANHRQAAAAKTWLAGLR